MKIALVGGGAGMVSFLCHLNDKNIKNSTIDIYSGQCAGVGEAYKYAPDSLIMNSRNDSLNMFDHICNYLKWLEKNYSKKCSFDDFVPRRVFGAYLLNVKSNLLDSLINNSNEINNYGEVYKIEEGTILISSYNRKKYDAIFISVGFGADYPVNKFISKIKAVPNNGKLTVLGTGLSSIDWILTANEIRPDLTIEAISRSEIFPAVRSNFEVSKHHDLFLKYPELLDKPCLISFFRALKTECLGSGEEGKEDYKNLFQPDSNLSESIEIAQTRIPIWQPVLYAVTKYYSQFIPRLPSYQRNWLFKNRAKFINRRAMFPIANAIKLNELISENILKVKKLEINEDMKLSSSVLNCKGLNKSEILFNKWGVYPDTSGHFVDQEFKCQHFNNVYAIGPITNTRYFFTEATSITYVQASIAISNYFK